ncbi:hypothetical protein [Streptomyces fuscigenes]|uniref:hypothetical protein n=1 Tax=Streptomyces fuscigenes TaxID=1528880 RepID=UPI001F2484EE|nr:hypothetical protein [Streptomyces fuscigenes]MCF3960423.1 hypothetical protein [Streptomyces fuscigenes]
MSGIEHSEVPVQGAPRRREIVEHQTVDTQIGSAHTQVEQEVVDFLTQGQLARAQPVE